MSLEEFCVVCDAQAIDIINAQEPLCTFFSEIGHSYQNTTVTKPFSQKYIQKLIFLNNFFFKGFSKKICYFGESL